MLLLLCLPWIALEGCGDTPAPNPDAHTAQTSARRTIAAGAFEKAPRTIGEFGHIGTGAGEFREAFGVGVESRSGDVYLVDTIGRRMQKFTSHGRFLLAWGWGVADGKTRALQRCRKRCHPGIKGPGPGQFTYAEGVAVDNDPSSPSYRDVYVVDIGNFRVEKFSPGGKFLLAFGGGVNQTARHANRHADEDVCPVKPGDVCGKGEKGQTGGQLELIVEGTFITVGKGGAVYVGERNAVKLFSPGGRYLSQIKLAPEPSPREGYEVGGVSALVVNSSGDMYVVRNGVSGVIEYSPAGKLLHTFEPGGSKRSYPEGPTPALALDQLDNIFIDVYADEVHRIVELSSRGTELASFDRGPKSTPFIADREDGLPGMAYSPRTKVLYLVNADVNVKPAVERVRMVKPPQP